MKVYLDNNATTPMDPRVTDSVLATMQEHFGNPSSATHAWGWAAEELVNIAREEVSQVIGAKASNIIFTGSATEAINLALRGLTHLAPKRFITSTVEHKAVLDNAALLEKSGIEVEAVGVDREGRIDLAKLEAALKKPTLLTSIIAANNEIGTVQDLSTISELCNRYNSVLHLDMVQALGKIPIDLSKIEVGLASFSAHKLYGPKGVGALYVTDTLLPELRALTVGGGHERGLRSGTLNVPGIVGFGKAAKYVNEEFTEIVGHVNELTAHLHEALRAEIPAISLNGHPSRRIPGNLNLSFPNSDGSRILSKLSSVIALSSSSACVSQDKEGSHVLKALGLSEELLKGSVRIGVGRFNTKGEVDFAAEQLIEVYNSLSN